MITLDYLAGFIDGEGSITIMKHKVRVSISNTNKEILDEIKRFIGYGYITSDKRRNPKWKIGYRYSTSNNKQSEKLLKLLCNKLIVKRDKMNQALNVLNEYNQILLNRKNRMIKAKKLIEEGKGIRETARIIGVSHSTILDWKSK